MTVLIILISYLLVTGLCLYVQKKTYEISKDMIPLVVLASFVPIFNIAILIVVLVILMEETNFMNHFARKILFIKDKE